MEKKAAAMEKKTKAEQFRKSKNNYFKRGYNIGKKSQVEIFVLMKRNDKFWTFINTDRPFWSSQADIVSQTVPELPSHTAKRLKNRNIAVAKTAADFETGNSTEQDVTSQSAAPEQIPTVPKSGVEAPQQIFQHVPQTWEGLFRY